MKTISIYFVSILFLVQTQALGEDKKVMESWDMSEISIDYLESGISIQEEVLQIRTLAIYDTRGSLIRKAEIKGEFNESESSVFKPLIGKCNFLTEIDGVLYYIKKN